jgi:hypothetical protein
MASSTSDPQISSTAYFTGSADDHWADLDHPHFYYDPGFKDFCQQRLAELGKLQQGWDSESAPPINRDIIGAVRNFVESLPRHVATRPMVVPLSSGSVQLEWHHGRLVLELEFESPNQVHYLKWHPDKQIEEENVIPASNRDELVALIRWFMKEMLDE